MQKISKFVTFDGKEHPNEKDAIKHLNRIVEDKLGKHADKLHGLTRMQIWDYLMGNIQDFIACSKILDDYRLNDDTDE